MFVFMVYAVRGRGKNHSVLRLTVDNDGLESRKRQEGDVTEIIDVTVTVCREIRSGIVQFCTSEPCGPSGRG